MAGSFLGALTGGAIGSAVVNLVLDDSRYKKQLAGAQAQATTATGQIGKSAALMGSIGAAGFLALGTAAVAFTGRAIQAASNQEEAANKVKVSFGEAGHTVEAFARTSAEAAGVSETAALEAAGGYGVMLQTAGLAQEQAASMSVELVKLASDLASFNNIALEGADGALAKLRSGLAGEAEPLRTMGILLSETRVKTEAYATGIAEAGAELTEAQKVQARYSLILKDSSLAQGDFARTSDSLANAQRTAAAELENGLAKVGKELLPVAKELVPLLSDLASTILPELAEGLGDIADQAGVAVDGLQLLVDLYQKYNDIREEAQGITEGTPAQGLTDILGGANVGLTPQSAIESVVDGIIEAAGVSEDSAEVVVTSWDAMNTAAREGGETAEDTGAAFGELGFSIHNFAHLSHEDLVAWRADVVKNINATFGTISSFDGQWRQAAGNFRENARKMARDSKIFTQDLRQLEELDLADAINKALLEEGPAAIHEYVESNRKGQADIREALRTTDTQLSKREQIIRDITGATEEVPSTKTIEVVVHYTYKDYDASKPIPGGVID